jgi:hypothetical protein
MKTGAMLKERPNQHGDNIDTVKGTAHNIHDRDGALVLRVHADALVA